MANTELSRAESLSTSGKVTETKAERNKAIALAYQGGETMTELARRYGLSISRISYICRDQGARLSREELSRVQSHYARRNMNDPAIRAKISETISKRWAAGHWAGRRKIFANDPAKREDYLALRDNFGAAYARQAMGLAA